MTTPRCARHGYQKTRRDFATSLPGMRATLDKTAGAKWFGERRHAPRDHRKLAATLTAFRQRGKKFLRIGMTRMRENRSTRRLFDDMAGVHHRDLLGHACHHAELMRDEQPRHAGDFLQLAQQLEYLRLGRHVERGGG